MVLIRPVHNLHQAFDEGVSEFLLRIVLLDDLQKVCEVLAVHVLQMGQFEMEPAAAQL